MGKRSQTKAKILTYVLNHPDTTRTELAKELNISMPTVLSSVNDLMEAGLLQKTGEFESTGGRKAKSLGINGSYCTAMGMMITANHLEMILVDMSFAIRKMVRVRLRFSPDAMYCQQVAEQVRAFLKDCDKEKPPIGIGLAVPGIVDQERKMIVKSHALGVENYSLHLLEQAVGQELYIENDANAAMMAENTAEYRNALYLSLNDTLGGAFCINGQLIRGQAQKAGEFGHMILYPGGKKCYCGKNGCADVYCAARVLTDDNEMTLDEFMERVRRGEAEAVRKWDRYLDDLAILVSNLRMAYDMDIILGGDVGGVIGDYMIPFSEKVMALNLFDRDTAYLKTCTFKKEASAVGVAKHFFSQVLMAF